MPTALDGPPRSAIAPLRVVVADDHDRYREGIVRGLERSPGIEVVAAVTTGTDALEAPLRMDPDVLLLDVHLPLLDAVEVLDLLADRPSLAASVVAISADPTSPLAERFRAAAGRPVLDKSSSRAAIRAAVLEHAPQPVAA